MPLFLLQSNYFCGAKAVKENLVAVNGVVHVIGNVMQPSEHTAVEYVKSNPKLSKVAKILEMANMKELLNSQQIKAPFTLFAPEDSAISELPTSTEQARSLVMKYILNPAYFSTMLPVDDEAEITSVDMSTSIKVKKDQSGKVTITTGDDDNTRVNVINADIGLYDGVLHVIDGVFQ